MMLKLEPEDLPKELYTRLRTMTRCRYIFYKVYRAPVDILFTRRFFGTGETKMTKQQKRIIAISAAICLPLSLAKPANAMHIMEGFLPIKYCIAWGVLCIPFFIAGYLSIKKTISQHRKTLLILAMAGAFAFVLSALKIPSVTGSSSHATGTGLGAILFGPSAMSIIGLIVLLFQAILLAHGGLTTLGANTFSMAIAGPFVAYAIYKLALKCKANKYIAVFLAAFLGDLFTYCITSIQLGLAHPSEIGGAVASIEKFLGIFALTQVPLAIIEGIITVVVIMGLESFAKPELKELNYIAKEVN